MTVLCSAGWRCRVGAIRTVRGAQSADATGLFPQLRDGRPSRQKDIADIEILRRLV
jgi:hypothetical protein